MDRPRKLWFRLRIGEAVYREGAMRRAKEDGDTWAELADRLASRFDGVNLAIYDGQSGPCIVVLDR